MGLRYVELKHGRICQLAFLGNIITRAGYHLPGNIDSAGTAFDSIPNGWAAVGAIPEAGLLQIISFVGLLELFVMKDITGGEFPVTSVTSFLTSDGTPLMRRPSFPSVELS